MWEATITVFGYSQSGKTQLINSYIFNEFTLQYTPTIEELHQCETRINGTTALLKIMDTEGCEHFKEMRQTYINFSDAFVLVYDVTNPNTVVILAELVAQIRSMCSKSTPLIIAGTKTDLLKSSSSDAIKQANKLSDYENIPHVLVSALNSTNVREVFTTAAAHLKPVIESQTKQDPFASHSIESWLYSKPHQHAQPLTPNTKPSLDRISTSASQAPHLHHKPSLKRSALKLKRSITKLRQSKSMKSLRNVVSSASLKFNNNTSHADPQDDVVIPLSRDQENFNSLSPVNFTSLEEKPIMIDIEPRASKCQIM